MVAIGADRNDGNGIDSGHVRLYAWDGSSWVQRGSDIDGEAAGDRSGGSVSLSADGSVVAIGADWNDGNGSSNSGHVRVYKISEADGYPLISIGALTDTDSDGRPDDCDSECTTLGMAADPDDDNDGVLDTNDTYPLISLDGLTDTDSDGEPDSCDSACEGWGMAADPDDDGDGVLDADDAFVLIPLSGRTDTDGDGRPDDCDSGCTTLGMTADSDDDNDGVLDALDAFPFDATESVDTDSDGAGK